MDGVGSWWILVETTTWTHREWELVRTVPVDGDRDRALARAAELARTCDASGGDSDDPEAVGRRVFRVSETSRLVEITRSRWDESTGRPATTTTHVRVSAAVLEHAHEPPPAEPPPRGRLRRALGRG
ncbi:hypothetical protein [Streptomyces sp. NPDC098101]|uniref:hypothetical protein n=1 Tax=Streptomyces sp. NPDC098101 TaxID=3366096 RepID=UPI0037F96F1A